MKDPEARAGLLETWDVVATLITAVDKLQNRVKNLETLVADRVITSEEKAASADRWRNSRSK